MKKLITIAILAIFSSGCSYFSDTKIEETKTPESEKSVTAPVEYEYSNQFLSTINSERSLNVADGFGSTVISFGKESQYYNFSILKPLKWFNDQVTAETFFTGSDNQEAGLYIMLLNNETEYYKTYSDCLSFVKAATNNGSKNERTITKEIHNNTWERVYYDQENQKRIEQCMIDDENLILGIGFYTEFTDSEKDITYEEIEIILNDLYFSAI